MDENGRITQAIQVTLGQLQYNNLVLSEQLASALEREGEVLKINRTLNIEIEKLQARLSDTSPE